VTHAGNETELIADAQAVLGDTDPVLHAGAFCLQGFMKQTVGGAPSPEKDAAELRPMTTKLIVAVTATKIHVLNWDEGDNERWVVATFDRATTTGTIKHFGLTRVLRLEDSATGAEMNLQVVGRLFAQSGPDANVLAALVPTA
jgi:hypothetical protein